MYGMRLLNRSAFTRLNRLPTSGAKLTRYSHFVTLGTVAFLATACARESGTETADTARLTQQTRVAAETSLSASNLAPTESVSKVAHAPNAEDSTLVAPLDCKPKTFGPGDTLILRMATPHGHYLWITKRDHTSYLVVFPPEMKLRVAVSMMPSEEFAQAATIRLPSDIKAVPYVYGRDTILESVFSEPGKYLLQVGDNFATDGGTAPPNCHLTFGR